MTSQPDSRNSPGTIFQDTRLTPALARSLIAIAGLLATSSIETFTGATSRIETFTGAMVALLIYAVGKSFLGPMMLAVASDRFPHDAVCAGSGEPGERRVPA